MQFSVENREGESLIENIIMEAMHDILEGEEIDKVLDDCENRPPCLYGNSIDDCLPPSFSNLENPFSPE